ncbi:hypothetical protein CALCODRAFT_135149 [Calocera cornea HHB12733]|uniref:AP complex mu/sigma subunit domain-containing protein n=1 Tax=Calocera cornea HHB12733 TaxID=1353952 RepID=A0A165CV22_9BASI|nr:hypothetical protein CALCODRAFT_135149 [Calocera cornea HHB12733]
MIHAVLIFNNNGLPRLTKYFVPPSQRQHILPKAIFALVSQRAPQLCNFLDVPRPAPRKGSSAGASGEKAVNGGQQDRVIYRNYATLYFVFVVDEGESELGMLDLIQVFVEALDRSFENVCELDLVFHFDEVHAILSEVVQGGVVLETNVDAIHEAGEFLSTTPSLFIFFHALPYFNLLLFFTSSTSLRQQLASNTVEMLRPRLAQFCYCCCGSPVWSGNL